jgi:hypothetical protein
MVLAVAPPVAAQDDYRLEPVDMGTTDLGSALLTYRSLYPAVSHDRNVAVFEHTRREVAASGESRDIHVWVVTASAGELTDDDVVRFAIFEDGVLVDKVELSLDELLARAEADDTVNTHAERLIYLYLSPEERRQVVRGESEFQPCLLRGRQCRLILRAEWFPNLTLVMYHWAYGSEAEEREKSRREHRNALNRWKRRTGGTPSLPFFTAPGQPAPSGGLASALYGRPGVDPGGIDLTSLELRYLADPPAGGEGGVRFAFSAPPTDGEPDTAAGRTAVLQASDAFFVWLVLDPTTFWVNLHPDEPDRIVDSQLGSTDVGRILLEADLQLKKTASELIHPDTDLGLRYWNQLDVDDGEQFCNATRQWIVPAPATIYEHQGELFILDAPLSVKMESSYLAEQDLESADCPGQTEPVRQHNEEVFRSLILPEVEEAVNEAPEFAELRQVYLSRVAAEWYRHRGARTSTMFADLIDSGDVSAWPARVDWSPEEVFDRFVESYTKGEFRVTHETRRGNVIETVTYVSGGVDFLSVPYDSLDAGQFDSSYQELPATVEASLLEAAADDAGRMWLGSVTGPRSVEASVDADGGPGAFGTLPRLVLVAVSLVLFVMVAGTVTGLVLIWRSRA